MIAQQPFIVGLGGTSSPGSSTENVLRFCLSTVEAWGARSMMVCATDIDIPFYNPATAERTEAARRLVSVFRAADGFIVASPSYHGGISGLIKNALDYAEDLRTDQRPYLEGLPVGCVICAAGAQGGVQGLAALRSIVHSLRAWPTPLGVWVNTSERRFDQDKPYQHQASAALETMARQVVEFTRSRRIEIGSVKNLVH